MITPPSEPNIVSLSLSLSLSALSFLGGIVKERRKIKAGAFPRKSFVSFRISSRSFAINFLGDDVGNNLAILFEMSEFLSVSEFKFPPEPERVRFFSIFRIGDD